MASKRRRTATVDETPNKRPTTQQLETSHSISMQANQQIIATVSKMTAQQIRYSVGVLSKEKTPQEMAQKYYLSREATGFLFQQNLQAHALLFDAAQFPTLLTAARYAFVATLEKDAELKELRRRLLCSPVSAQPTPSQKLAEKFKVQKVTALLMRHIIDKFINVVRTDPKFIKALTLNDRSAITEAEHKKWTDAAVEAKKEIENALDLDLEGCFFPGHDSFLLALYSQSADLFMDHTLSWLLQVHIVTPLVKRYPVNLPPGFSERLLGISNRADSPSKGMFGCVLDHFGLFIERGLLNPVHDNLPVKLDAISIMFNPNWWFTFRTQFELSITTGWQLFLECVLANFVELFPNDVSRLVMEFCAWC